MTVSGERQKTADQEQADFYQELGTFNL